MLRAGNAQQRNKLSLRGLGPNGSQLHPDVDGGGTPRPPESIKGSFLFSMTARRSEGDRHLSSPVQLHALAQTSALTTGQEASEGASRFQG